ncbi:hypothetical protein GCM10009850_122450 [Nonomuraea monospora]|uniref:Uncharacterized protein n=1 Tax=Nonomuraea monospora TaxID=568818 RepID=A0ABP5PZH5_9ACTN
MKVPLGAAPASNVPDSVWFAPPEAILWLGVEGPSTYSPILSCMRPVRAETTTEEPEITSPSEGEVICPEESARTATTDAWAVPPSAMDPATIIPAATTLPTTVTTLPSIESLAPPEHPRGVHATTGSAVRPAGTVTDRPRTRTLATAS